MEAVLAGSSVFHFRDHARTACDRVGRISRFVTVLFAPKPYPLARPKRGGAALAGGRDEQASFHPSGGLQLLVLEASSSRSICFVIA